MTRRACQIKVACPIRGVNCVAKTPRWIDVWKWKQRSKLRPGGVCVKCCKGKYRTLKEVQRDFPHAENFRIKKSGTQIFIRCPFQKLNCSALKPRWLYVLSTPKKGVCFSCSKSRGGRLDAHGYKVFNFRGKTVKEHRWIMEKMLGRKLRKGETVHHINGKRADNREKNLELRMSGNHPKGWSLRQMRNYLRTVPKRLGGLK